MDYILHILILVAIFTVVAASLDLLAGHTGLLSIAHAAFFGLGAYTSTLLSIRFDVPFLLGVLAGVAVAIVVSFVISTPSLRLHGDYFVIATFAFQMILFSIFNNWTNLTNGPLGIPGIPPPNILGFIFQSRGDFFFLAAIFAAITFLVLHLIATSPFGRVLHAIREDEVFAQAMGKNTLKFKVLAFAVSAAFAASAGSLYAHYITFIDPTSFTATESILVLSMVIIGGAGSTWGPLVGASVLVALPEALRFLGLPSSAAANMRQVTYGSLLVVMMMFRPRGLVGRYDFGR